MTDKQLMQLALEALEAMTCAFMDTEGSHGSMEQAAHEVADQAVAAIKEALAQPEGGARNKEASP